MFHDGFGLNMGVAQVLPLVWCRCRGYCQSRSCLLIKMQFTDGYEYEQGVIFAEGLEEQWPHGI